MSPRLLHLRERTTHPLIPLSPQEVQALRGVGAGLRILATEKPGLFDIETAQYVGALAGPGLRVLIEPKLSLGRVLYLLSYTHGIGRLLEKSGALGAATGLVELMQALYCQALERGLRSGVVRGYERRCEDLVFLRGRPDINALWLRRFGTFPPVSCEFDELTVNTEPNRRLLAAASRLARLESDLPEMAQTLRRLSTLFDGVSRVQYVGRLPQLRTDRRYAPFAPALSLAELILENSSLELRDGRLEAIGLLVNMEDLFEKFVVTVLSEAMLRAGGEWEYHPDGVFMDVRQRVKLTPDVVWWAQRNRAKLVLDVKYKTTKQGENPDLYQMLAYCVALGLRRGVLLYADAEETTYLIGPAGVEIHVLRFDASGEPEEIHARVKVLAERLIHLAEDNFRANRA
ncbi:McrC family protein [Archangium violaceum]|uniref:McrC family protein n=1 Tax=Archangium violaceum TaxID=83451 RepID=UPI0013639D6C|nr:hypothetical protein [Archangium violaceum]